MTEPQAPVGRLTRRRALPVVAAVAAVTVGLTWLVAGSPEASAAQAPAASVTWQPCPVYSDDVLRSLSVQDARLPEARALLARMECGTVDVPLNYTDPHGRRITIAMNRIKAVDQKHRIGMLALNPGGPGGSGYLMPLQVALENASTAGLNNRYDLVGFDPRGVNYSTKVNCAPTGAPPVQPNLGPLTETVAKRMYAWDIANNASCGATDVAFLSQLTTPNVARDLDRVRSALGESTLHLLGVSWGTYLGTVYRTLFPSHSGRMFLDSVLPPIFLKATKLDDDAAVAIEHNAERMAQFMAEHNDTYRFGTTQAQVRAALIALVQDYDANPRHFSDTSNASDGAIIARLSAQLSQYWPQTAQALAELRTAKTGDATPPTVKEILAPPPAPGPPAEDAPEKDNRTMGKSTVCNDDPERPDFAAVWTSYQRRVASNPMTGRATPWYSGCVGWPTHGYAIRLTRAGGQLVLSGHRYEIVTPYNWMTQTQAVTGGMRFTVEDDVHGSVIRTPECAAKLLAFFDTGAIDGGCAGLAAEFGVRGDRIAYPNGTVTGPGTGW